MISDDKPLDAEEEISKSQRKRDADAIRAFAARLIHTPAHKLKQLPISDQLRQAIADCPPPSTRGAHKRHIQYISKLIRKADGLQELEQLLDVPRAATNPHAVFCNQLIEAFTANADMLRQKYPGVSLQQARQLAKTAKNLPPDNSEESEKAKQARNKSAKARKSLLKLLTEASV